MSFDPRSLRKDFAILERPLDGHPVCYLDNAATTQRPRQVLETLVSFYTRWNANIHRSPHRLGRGATDLYEQAHRSAAKFIGAKSEREIVFVRNTTEALNLVAACFIDRPDGARSLRPGDEVIVTLMEHHSNFVPWQAACARRGLTLRVAGLNRDGTLDMPAFRNLLGTRTRLVCCTHVSNVLGAINPAREIADCAHAAGALLLLDGAQSVPHLPVDVRSLDCDFLAFSGHKMLGPFGIGVLYGRQELLEQMSPFLYGGDMIRSVTLAGSTWNDLPWKFEAGTPDIAAGVALGGAFDPESRERLPGAMDYLSSLGMAEIRAHELDLIEAFLSGIGTVPGIRTYGPENTRLRSGLVSFNAEGADPFLLAELLDRRGISVRAGSLCAYPLLSALGETGMIRFSPYVYNTREEVARLVESVREILACEIV